MNQRKNKNMWKEFKDFIMTGNVIEFAVAVILAGAISAVVNGFVNDIMMPIVGHFTGGMDFSSMKIILTPAEIGADGQVISPEASIKYGNWINSIVSLIIIGFVLFLMIKAYNKTRKPKAEEAPAGPTELDLLKEIRDELRK